MKKIIIIFAVSCSFVILSCAENRTNELSNAVKLVNNEAEKKVDILVDGKLFTSYIYNDTISVLKKTVLFPIIAPNAVAITRGFPLDSRPGERVDHPHHIGAWFNYGDVNGLDFWNNSNAVSEDRLNEMGTIRHDQILEMEDGEGEGELRVSANWLNPDGEVLLKEVTNFDFYAAEHERIIDRTVTLTALDKPVLFKDNKEGMVAIRVARQLEHPSDSPVTLSDAHGKKTDVPVMDNTGVTGHYLNSEGIEGTDVWAKRAKWVSLEGTIENKDVTVAIFDFPENVGFPTYWHARGYGLFSANPLGQNVFSEGKETLNYSLNPGESVTFKYRIIIFDGKKDKATLEKEFQNFINN